MYPYRVVTVHTLHFNAVTVDMASLGNAISFENIVGSDNDDNITGDSASNVIAGAEGTDTLYGGGGDDFIYGVVNGGSFPMTTIKLNETKHQIAGTT